MKAALFFVLIFFLTRHLLGLLLGNAHHPVIFASYGASPAIQQVNKGVQDLIPHFYVSVFLWRPPFHVARTADQQVMFIDFSQKLV